MVCVTSHMSITPSSLQCPLLLQLIMLRVKCIHLIFHTIQLEKQTPKIPPTMNDATQRPTNNHIICGSPTRVMKASPMAYPKALVKRYIACTNDFIDGGAFMYAYSRPVTEAKISETPM